MAIDYKHPLFVEMSQVYGEALNAAEHAKKIYDDRSFTTTPLQAFQQAVETIRKAKLRAGELIEAMRKATDLSIEDREYYVVQMQSRLKNIEDWFEYANAMAQKLAKSS